MNRNSEIHQHSLRPDLLGARRSANSQRILGRLERNAGQRSRQLAVMWVGGFAAALLIGALAWLAWSNGAAPKGAGNPGARAGEVGAHFGAAGLAAEDGANPTDGAGGARVLHGAATENGGARLLREQPAAGSSQFETALSIAQVAAGVKASTQAALADAARGTAPASQPGAPGAQVVRAPGMAPALARGGASVTPATAASSGANAQTAAGARVERAAGADRLAVATATKPAAAPKERARSQGSGTASDSQPKARATARGRTLAALTARQRAAQSAHTAEPQAAGDTDPDVALISAIRQASRPAGN